MTAAQPNLATEERLDHLMGRLRRDGSFTIVDAAADLGVSEMTIRRDIEELERRGSARRVRGGALPLWPQSFAARKGSHTRAKSAIAAKLAAMVPPSGTIALDASSTMMRAAVTITGASDLRVFTNGPDTFRALQRGPGLTPVLSGGSLDLRTGSLVGPLASWSARQISPDVLFCSAFGVSAEVGASEVAIEEADVKRSMALGARRIVLAVDASKLDRNAAVVSLGWSDIDVLVTELDPRDSRLAAYRSLVDIV